MAEPAFTAQELQRFNGEHGERVYIAFRGVVYDVTDCSRWHTGLHEEAHFAGIDLTDFLSEAPHAAEVFTRPCVKRIGLLKT
jgi:predicted heme/steroid binding protein